MRINVISVSDGDFCWIQIRRGLWVAGEFRPNIMGQKWSDLTVGRWDKERKRWHVVGTDEHYEMFRTRVVRKIPRPRRKP